MRRSRGMRARSRARRDVDWISTWANEDVGNPGPNSLTLELVGSLDMTQKDGKLTVERMVGDILIFNPTDGAGVPANMCRVHAGILVQELDGGGNVMGKSPSSPVDMEDAWLWLANWTVGGPSGLVPDFTVAFHTQGYRYVHFDVHVRRKMHDRQILVLILEVQSIPQAGFDTVNLAKVEVFGRTLVKLS